MLAAFSLFLPLLLGLGLLPLTAARKPWPGVAQDSADRATMLATTLALGVAGFYALALILDDVNATLLFGASLSLLGWGLAAGRGRGRFLAAFALGPGPWLLLAAVLLAGAFYILLTPLALWDPRLMWFQQGHLIFQFGDLGPIREWGADPSRVTQAFYPKLVPLLAAGTAMAVGFWNDYLPKLALLALLAPPAFALLAFWRQPFTLTFIAIAFFLVPREFMWNGYLDGYLALYAGFAAIHLGRWLEEHKAAALLAALAFLGVAGGLKNEANLLYLALAGGLVFAWWRGRLPLRAVPMMRWLDLLIPAIVAFAGFAIWHLLRRHWGLAADLDFGTAGWARMMARLGDPEALALIAYRLLLGWHTLGTLLLLGCGFWLMRRWQPTLPAGSTLAFAAAALYLGGLFLVYLVTPNDLAWHLATSAKRILMLPRALVFAGLALWLFQCERATAKTAIA